MHQLNNNRNGFTLIELMLSMTFVSFLLIAIALLTIQISNIYTKGVTLRQVNEAGLEVTADLQRAIQSSDAFEVPLVGNNESVVKQDTGGRLCLGTYSYAWNLGRYFDQDVSRLSNKFNNDNQTLADTPIRLVKVSDANKSLCQADNSSYPDIPTDSHTVELLAVGDRDLAVQDLSISGSKDRGLYSIEITLGTNNQSTIIDDTCKPPRDAEGAEDYCAVNKFDIVARTANKAGQ